MTKTFLSAVIFLFYFLTEISAQKVVLQLDGTPSTTPSVSKAALRYNKDFAYSLTLDDCTQDHYSVAKPLFRGGVVPNLGYTSAGLFFTDGCGNNIEFKPGIAWNSTTAAGYGPNNGSDDSKMSWAQLQEVYGLGWDVLNHSYAHRAGSEITGSYTYASEITQNNDNVRTRLGVEMPCFVVPSGDNNYQSVALQLGHKVVFDQSFPAGIVFTYGGIPIDNNFNTTNLRVYRENIYDQITNPTKLADAANRSTGGTHIWYNELAHHIEKPVAQYGGEITFYQFKDYMLNAANTYGKNGNDRMWMAPPQEVYEYIVSRQSASYNLWTPGNNTLEINLNLSAVPTWLRRKTLTLVINSSVNFSNVTLPQGITATWKGTGNTKLLNLDFTNYSPSIPVELVSFSAQAKGTTGLLNWETASERRFQHFEVERSLDGTHYIYVGTVKAKGTAARYAFEDANFQKTSYYRLKMVNDDGSFAYSKIVSLLVPSKYTVKVTPSVLDKTVTIEADFDDRNPTTMSVFDQTGKLLIQQNVLNGQAILLETLPKGVYFVRVNHANEFWVQKIVWF